MVAMVAGVALGGAWVPMAHAEVIFVDCEFSVPKPAINDVDGQQYVGARLDADNCHTKLPSAPLMFDFSIEVSNQESRRGLAGAHQQLHRRLRRA